MKYMEVLKKDASRFIKKRPRLVDILFLVFVSRGFFLFLCLGHRVLCGKID